MSATRPSPYKVGIIAAITELKDRTGSSRQAIKKHMETDLQPWDNSIFLQTLKDMAAAGDLVQVKSSYKLSADFVEKAAVSTYDVCIHEIQ